METLRERKKAATRLALHRAALRLAVERGFTELTVDAIADAAEVSRRTFSNYFASKEDALLYGDRSRGERLLEGLRSRPAAEPPWAALRATAAGLYAGLGTLDPQWVAQLQLVRRHPAVLAQQVANHTGLEADLAAELRRRSPGVDALTSRVMAAGCLAALRAATAVWLDEQGAQPLPDLIGQALDILAASWSHAAVGDR